ncbi:2TM domain-containing protein [Candidatus Acetothermia bacterium]|nr:2TM domain-containing protein [Candidatus Acetothermia bacterium]
MSSEDIFEQSLRGELREIAHSSHPSFAMLFSHAQQNLEASQQGSLMAHVVSCARCQRELQTIREELTVLDQALPQFLRQSMEEKPSPVIRETNLWQRWWQSIRAHPFFYVHVSTYAAAAAVLIAFNRSQMCFPTPSIGCPQSSVSWWVQWFLVPWGLLLAAHIWKTFKNR